MKQALIISTLLHLALLTSGWSVLDRPPHPSGRSLNLTLQSSPLRAGQSGSAPQTRGDYISPGNQPTQRQMESATNLNKKPAAPVTKPTRHKLTSAEENHPHITPSSPAPPSQMLISSPEPHAKLASSRDITTAERQENRNPPASDAAGGNQLRSALQTALAPHFHYPSLARRRGWQGIVELTVHIAGDGRLDGIRVIRSSGHAILDKAAHHALQQVTHVPTAHYRIPGDGLEMILPVEYRLVDS